MIIDVVTDVKNWKLELLTQAIRNPTNSLVLP